MKLKKRRAEYDRARLARETPEKRERRLARGRAAQRALSATAEGRMKLREIRMRHYYKKHGRPYGSRKASALSEMSGPKRCTILFDQPSHAAAHPDYAPNLPNEPAPDLRVLMCIRKALQREPPKAIGSSSEMEAAGRENSSSSLPSVNKLARKFNKDQAEVAKAAAIQTRPSAALQPHDSGAQGLSNETEAASQDSSSSLNELARRLKEDHTEEAGAELSFAVPANLSSFEREILDRSKELVFITYNTPDQQADLHEDVAEPSPLLMVEDIARANVKHEVPPSCTKVSRNPQKKKKEENTDLRTLATWWRRGEAKQMKSRAQVNKEYRVRKKLLESTASTCEPKQSKSRTEVNREYRERKKLIRMAILSDTSETQPSSALQPYDNGIQGSSLAFTDIGIA
ncbi:hypothetical protein HPB47_025516 [Ixodes persulcatus]|uniref:Uncharacterized protein n=1 Tax=Ixodes persulcatus TaxID=34615 RepID=A0AC60Q1B3_IXOPE|nr:hypothetical protein HPB47_025516 [Ixodes persulcatus]